VVHGRGVSWLELLRVVSELVAAAPSSDEDADAAG
jgi:hypothetical protein